MNWNGNFEIVVKTFQGLEETLADEMTSLGLKDARPLRRAVSFRGNLEDVYKANYGLRTALKVLVPISQFNINSIENFNKTLREIPWPELFGPDNTMSIDSMIKTKLFDHSGYVSQLVKDAIVDRFRQETGARPSINNDSPDIGINVHIVENDCIVSLDSSGESLHKRGYRTQTNQAPINEVLAAGLIRLTGWNGQHDFIDFMCGSGTLLIEAAMMGLNIPPGLYRHGYCFENWSNYDPDLFEKMQEAFHERKLTCNIIGSDISGRAVEIALANIRNASLEKWIKVSHTAFQKLPPNESPCTIMLNPPYGERLKMDDINTLYGHMGSKLKQDFTKATAWVISSNKEAIKYIGLHPTAKRTFLNGNIECKFLRFNMYQGSAKQKYKAPGEKTHQSRTSAVRGDNTGKRPVFTKSFSKPTRDSSQQ